MTTPRKRDAVEREIKETISLVPSFFNRIPDKVLSTRSGPFSNTGYRSCARSSLFSGLDPEDLHELSLLTVEEASHYPRFCVKKGDTEADDLFVVIGSSLGHGGGEGRIQ